MIIDFHTHPFLVSSENSCFYQNTINDFDDFTKDMENAGISVFCGSVIEKTKSITKIKELNCHAVKLRDISNGKYIPGIHVHPHYKDESIEMLNDAHSIGINLVGELVPYYHGWESYYEGYMADIYSEIDRLNMTVSLHTQCEESIEKALKEFKNITFVLAHPREKEDFYAHIERIKKYDNCYIDLSGSGLFRYGMLKTLVNEVGSERILFGSDYPICNPKMYVQAVDFEKISDREKENIYCENARRILRN